MTPPPVPENIKDLGSLRMVANLLEKTREELKQLLICFPFLCHIFSVSSLWITSASSASANFSVKRAFKYGNYTTMGTCCMPTQLLNLYDVEITLLNTAGENNDTC
jgi:hypothetical protein